MILICGRRGSGRTETLIDQLSALADKRDGLALLVTATQADKAELTRYLETQRVEPAIRVHSWSAIGGGSLDRAEKWFSGKGFVVVGADQGLPPGWSTNLPEWARPEVLVVETPTELTTVNFVTAEEHEQTSLSSTDHEPPPGSIVRDVRDVLWRRGSMETWLPIDETGAYTNDDAETWTRVAGNYGPVTVVTWGGDDE